jgi:hypothetical protein
MMVLAGVPDSSMSLSWASSILRWRRVVLSSLPDILVEDESDIGIGKEEVYMRVFATEKQRRWE